MTSLFGVIVWQHNVTTGNHELLYRLSYVCWCFVLFSFVLGEGNSVGNWWRGTLCFSRTHELQFQSLFFSPTCGGQQASAPCPFVAFNPVAVLGRRPPSNSWNELATSMFTACALTRWAIWLPFGSSLAAQLGRSSSLAHVAIKLATLCSELALNHLHHWAGTVVDSLLRLMGFKWRVSG